MTSKVTGREALLGFAGGDFAGNVEGMPRTASAPADEVVDPGPPLVSLLWASFVIAGGAVVAGLVVGQVVLALGSTVQDTSGADAWATLIATGVAVAAIASFAGRRLGAPSIAHLAAGAVGPLLLGLLFALVAPSGLIAVLVAAAYAVLAVAGLRRGDRLRASSR